MLQHVAQLGVIPVGPPANVVAILIADARSFQQPIDVAPLNGLPMAHAPRLQADRGSD